MIPTALAAVGALTAIAAVSWRAAEEGRGLDLADLRSVILISVAVWVASAVLTRRAS
jgi:hypothetical protein